jgi:prephenate dehydrogenase
MAGKAICGFENSDAQLFEGRAWVLTPRARDPVDKLKTLQGLIASVGATLHLMTPSAHDQAVTVASQLPQLTSTALMLTASDHGNEIAGPALREMTRLAASPASLWNGLTQQNAQQLIGELQSLKSYLTELEMAVHFNEPLDKWFNRANTLRAALEQAAVAKAPPAP